MIPLRELLFFLYFGLMLWVKGVGMTGGTFYNAVLVFTTLFVLLGMLFFWRATPEEYLADAALLVLCGILPWRIAGNQGPLWCILLVIAMRCGVSSGRAAAFAMKVWGFAFLFQMIVQLTWVKPRDFVIHSRFGIRYVIRWALGYSHPNVLQIFSVLLIMLFFYHFRPRGRKLALALLLTSFYGGWVFLYSLSTTGLLMLLLFLVCYLVLLKLEDGGSSVAADLSDGRGSYPVWLRVIVQIYVPVVVILSLGAPILLGGKAFDLVNRLFHTRPALTRRYLTEVGLSAFGSPENLGMTTMLDCSYANLLIWGGVIPFLLLNLGLLFLMRRLLIRKDSAALAIAIASLTAGMTEPFLFNTSYKNILLIFLGAELHEWFMTHPKLFPGRTICLFPGLGERRLRVARFFETRILRKIFAVVLILACAAGIAGSVLKPVPDSIYAMRVHCDVDDREPVLYLTRAEAETLRDQQGAWLLSYRDEMTPMHRLTGPIIKVERIRSILSSGMLGMAMGITILMLFPRGWLAMVLRRFRRKGQQPEHGREEIR